MSHPFTGQNTSFSPPFGRGSFHSKLYRVSPKKMGLRSIKKVVLVLVKREEKHANAHLFVGRDHTFMRDKGTLIWDTRYINGFSTRSLRWLSKFYVKIDLFLQFLRMRNPSHGASLLVEGIFERVPFTSVQSLDDSLPNHRAISRSVEYWIVNSRLI